MLRTGTVRAPRSDDEIHRLNQIALQLFRAFAEIGDGHLLGDTYDGVADFLHHTANRAAGFVGTGAFLVKVFTHATDRRERAFDVTDDFSKRDLVRRASEAITTGDTAFALHDLGGLKVVEDLFEESAWNSLLFCDDLDAHDGIIFEIITAQRDQSSKSVFTSDGKFHVNVVLNPIERVKFIKIRP